MANEKRVQKKQQLSTEKTIISLSVGYPEATTLFFVPSFFFDKMSAEKKVETDKKCIKKNQLMIY